MGESTWGEGNQPAGDMDTRIQLARIEGMLTGTLARHDQRLDQHENTLSQHDMRLNDKGKLLARHDERIEDLEEDRRASRADVKANTGLIVSIIVAIVAVINSLRIGS